MLGVAIGSQFLLRNGGGSVAIPSFRRDFAGVKTLNHGIGPDITFTRTGTATYFDATGTLTTATADVARFDHDPSTFESKGLLIEEGRTNSIRNSQAGGSTNGVIGSGGALPTNWGISSNFTGTGLTREVIGTGTANGFAYMDVKISGTNTSGSAINPGFAFESGTQIAALSGQTWASSVYVALASGSLSGLTSLGVNVVERNSGGTFLTDSRTSILSMTSSLTRFAVTRTLTDATTAFVNPSIIGNINNGSSVDFTLRIAAPQLEQGAFPTSYIPTTTAAATRSADSAVVTPISSFYNQSEGTLFAEYSVPTLPVSATFPRVVQIGNQTNNNNRFTLTTSSSGGSLQHLVAYFVDAVGQLDKSQTTGSVGAIAKAAAAVALNNGHYAVNGSLVGAEDTSLSLGASANFTHLLVAQAAGGVTGAQHIRKIAYYPKRLSNETLKSLTA